MPCFPELLLQYMSDHSDIPYVNFLCPLSLSWHKNVTFSIYPSVKIWCHTLSSSDKAEHSELVQATDIWRGGPGWFDTVFVQEQSGPQTINSGGLTVAHARLFF